MVVIEYLKLKMISLEELRKIDPDLENISDEELIKIRHSLYSLGKLSLETFIEKKTGSKYPIRVYGLNNDDMRD